MHTLLGGQLHLPIVGGRPIARLSLCKRDLATKASIGQVLPQPFAYIQVEGQAPEISLDQ